MPENRANILRGDATTSFPFPLDLKSSITSISTKRNSATHLSPLFFESEGLELTLNARPISLRSLSRSTSTSVSLPTPLQQIGIDARLRAKRESERLSARNALLLPRSYHQHIASPSQQGRRTSTFLANATMESYQSPPPRPVYQHNAQSAPSFGPTRSHSGVRLHSIVEEDYSNSPLIPCASAPVVGAKTTSSSVNKLTTTVSAPTLPVNSANRPRSLVLKKRIHTDSGRKPARDWQKLPQPILDLILSHVEHFHAENTCSHCHARALRAVQLTCKSWSQVAQRRLYTNIILTMPSSTTATSTKEHSLAVLEHQIIHLRRTLRAYPQLSRSVQHIHVPDPLIPLYESQHPFNPNPAYDRYLSLLASLVMALPNLRTFNGFIPFYNHTFDRLTYALSTRPLLESHCWLIAENAEIDARAMRQCAPGIMSPGQQGDFVGLHDRWAMTGSLKRFALCSPGGRGVLEHGVFVNVLRSLRVLEELCVAGFDKDDFHDETLITGIPATVRKLRLEELKGVTMKGLTKWSGMPNRRQLQVLALINMEIELLKLGRLLGGLESLKGLVVVQNGMQQSTEQEDGCVLMQPIFASRTLEWLHWDIGTSRSGPAGARGRKRLSKTENVLTPNQHLALSIQHDGFPRLRRLRVPKDNNPNGVLEAACASIPKYDEFRASMEDISRNGTMTGGDESHHNPTNGSRTTGRKSKEVVVTVREMDLSDDESASPGEGLEQIHPAFRNRDVQGHQSSALPPIDAFNGIRNSTASTNSTLSNQSIESSGTVDSDHTDPQTLFGDVDGREGTPSAQFATRKSAGNDGAKDVVLQDRFHSTARSLHSFRRETDRSSNSCGRIMMRPIFWTGSSLDGAAKVAEGSERSDVGPSIVTWSDFLLVSERRRAAAGQENAVTSMDGRDCNGCWDVKQSQEGIRDNDYDFERKDKPMKKRLSWSLKSAKEKKEVDKSPKWAVSHVPRTKNIGGYAVKDLLAF